MALRKGVTTREEFQVRLAIKAGKSWETIARELEDVDLEHVYENIYKPLFDQHKAGEDITSILPQAGDLSRPSGAQDGPPPGDEDPAKVPPAGTKPL
jgi:hypothetical protein